jgi:hypothetical protein
MNREKIEGECGADCDLVFGPACWWPTLTSQRAKAMMLKSCDLMS